MESTDIASHDSPLTAVQRQALEELLQTLDLTQKVWVSGYFAGLINSNTPPDTTQQAAEELIILFGSQTGNAKHLAFELHEKATRQGVPSSVVDMADFKPQRLKKVHYLVIVTSTHGEGEPPDNAILLHQFLRSKRAPQLKKLNYAVIGLGDSSYQYFCQTAIDFDISLEALGAHRLLATATLDVDYENQAKSWQQQLTTLIKSVFPEQSKQTQTSSSLIRASAEFSSAGKFGKANTFSATVLTQQKITAYNSGKDIRHLELQVDSTDFHYKPGDALGVYFDNHSELVTEILEQTGTDSNTVVTVQEQSVSLRDALTEKLELTRPGPTFVEHWAKLTNCHQLKQLTEKRKNVIEWLANRQVIDIVRQFPAVIQPQQLVDSLLPLQPRLYSIASAQEEAEDEVHLTVAVVRYTSFDHIHHGAASGYLSRLQIGDTLKVYVEPNRYFRLPQNTETPVIMVGAGTGIAPFRAFLQARESSGAPSRNWLFFGNPHFTRDFLYQTEIQRYLKGNLLTHIDLAFSRDQEQKIYVQHRLLERGNEVWRWLQDGAHFYICGDAQYMAKDVEQTLVNIISTHGDYNNSQARSYLEDLRQNQRFQKDIY
ncbi:MAG: assimilatory sulfite reductase (NADPH) flavoprotein subunit [Pseudomonadota bacterium]